MSSGTEFTKIDRRALLWMGLASGVAGAVPTGPLYARTACLSPGASGRSEAFVRGQDPATIAMPVLPKASEGRIAVPDGSLWYLDSGGSGPPVVLVHATTGTARSWDYQFDQLSRAGFRVIAYSRRGTVQSTTVKPADYVTETADLLALADSLKLAKFHLLGTASGGFVAIRFAVAQSQRLLSLTLSCSLLGLNEPAYNSLTERLLPPAFGALPSEFKEISPSYRAANPEGVRRWLAVESESAAAQLKKRPDMQAVMQAGLRGGGNGPSFSDLQALTMPVHLIYGDADLYSPPAIARAVMPHLRNAHLTILGETGHAAYWEQPDNFVRACLAFWARHRRLAC